MDTLRQRLGSDNLPVEELADIPGAPRKPFLAREDLTAMLVTLASILVFAGGAAGALIVIASGGATALAVAAAVAGAAAGVAVVGIIAHHLKQVQTRELERQLAAGGLVLWVRVRSPERENKAQQILRACGAEAIRVHEIEIAKRLEDLPLRFLHREPAVDSGDPGHASPAYPH
jgi:hypothetical protein